MYRRLDLSTLAPQTYDAGRAALTWVSATIVVSLLVQAYLMHVRQTCMGWHVATVGRQQAWYRLAREAEAVLAMPGIGEGECINACAGQCNP